MARPAVLVGVWVAGTAVSVALGWGAVGLVRSNVDLTSSADSAARPADDGTVPTPAPSRSPRRVVQTFELRGGTVQASCDGSGVSLGYATPKGGYEVSVHDEGPVELSVRFRSDSHESRLDATCVSGSPAPRIREEPR